MTRMEGERKTEASPRVRKLREKIRVMPEICIERACLMTAAYRKNENAPAIIRRAKALEKVLSELTIRIEDGELIVGSATSKRRGAPLFPEIRCDWYLKEMVENDTVSTRDCDRMEPLTQEEKTKVKKFLRYWRGKSVSEKWRARIPENLLKLNHKICAGIAKCEANGHDGHIGVDNAKVVHKGLKDVKEEVQENLRNLNFAEVSEFEKFQFLSAVNIVLDATINFAKRYSKLASIMAKKETNSARKAELKKIADICNRVPENPARTFYEGLQSIWFTHLAVMMEGWGGSISLGRPDQYLYPLYKKDIGEGIITREEARELISLLYVKINGLVFLNSTDHVTYSGGFPQGTSITIGGLTRNGNDAVNDLSYLFLDAEEEVRLRSEDIIIRVHKNNPDRFLIRACEVARSVKGKIKFVSDETAIKQLLIDGKPIEYARDYIVVGCYILTVPGFSHDLPGGMFNLPLMLELALNNGVSRLTGEQIGPKTGDPKKFKSYTEVWEAYKKQVEALVPVALLFRNVDKQVYAEVTPYPLQSAFFHGCIEKGLDITNGGTFPYMTRGIGLVGAPNVGDSLAAIKKAVFQDKKMTMDKLITALDKNFDSTEDILYRLKKAPKFGNDDDYVDSIVNEVICHASNYIAKYKSFSGALSTTAAGAATANVPMGHLVGATPDGRKSGEPLSEGGISPYQGRNISGPTATMRSVAKLDLLKLTNGSVLNMRFNPEALNDETKIIKFASLIRTYCETGGYLVQFNIVSTDTLRDAQNHPEKYRDLLVRVATYSSYFVELSKELQDDIIARTEFQEC